MCACAARSPAFAAPHASGHCYFALKDDKRQDRGGDLEGRPRPHAVQAGGGPRGHRHRQLTTYPGSSNYQIVIEALEPAGIGALMALLEERKKKLAAEGLFDAARKQLLPFLPDVIGVVTSPTGAVIRDILHRLADRFPRRVLVWPVRVQGEGSAERGRRRHRRLQRAAGGRRDAAPRPADRRARRRLARRPVVVQRGDRGARGGREHDPADLRGRPRDRLDADRLRRRPARADADRRGRNGGAGARRTVRRRSTSFARAAHSPAGGAVRRRGAPNCARPRARCRTPTSCSPCRASSSTAPLPRCRARCAQCTRMHHRRFTQISGGLTLRVLRAQVGHAKQSVASTGARLAHCTQVVLRHRRDRFAGLAVRLKASRLANAQAQRAQIVRANERTQRLAERARRALITSLQRHEARVRTPASC